MRKAPPLPVGPSLLLRCVRRCPTLPHSLPCSTIGAGGLNFRDRDGTGCFPSAKTTETPTSTTLTGAEIIGSGASTATNSLIAVPPAAPVRRTGCFLGTAQGPEHTQQ